MWRMSERVRIAASFRDPTTFCYEKLTTGLFLRYLTMMANHSSLVITPWWRENNELTVVECRMLERLALSRQAVIITPQPQRLDAGFHR
jgi:hypothetical protein